MSSPEIGGGNISIWTIFCKIESLKNKNKREKFLLLCSRLHVQPNHSRPHPPAPTPQPLVIRASFLSIVKLVLMPPCDFVSYIYLIKHNVSVKLEPSSSSYGNGLESV